VADGLQLQLVDSGDLKRLAKALRAQSDGKQLRRELTQGLRGVLRPLVPQVRAAYRAGPSRGGRRRRPGPGLRALLASSVRTEVRLVGRVAGARIRADGRRMPTGMKALPRYWEGANRRPWRHPVHGNRAVWVAQPSHPAFYQAVRPAEAAARREVERIARQVAAKLERSL
jgi:hypothetical protein